MKIQHKLLTEEQKKVICDTYYSNKGCEDCPLHLGANCYDDVEKLQKEIDDYWNEEIEINEEN